MKKAPMRRCKRFFNRQTIEILGTTMKKLFVFAAIMSVGVCLGAVTPTRAYVDSAVSSATNAVMREVDRKIAAIPSGGGATNGISKAEAQSLIAVAKGEAIDAAADDATIKANAAKSEAVSTASEDAASKASAAKAEAIAAAGSAADTKIENALVPYALSSDVASSYLAKSDAVATYQPKGKYLTDSDLGSFASTGKVYIAENSDASDYSNKLWDKDGDTNYDATDLLGATDTKIKTATNAVMVEVNRKIASIPSGGITNGITQAQAEAIASTAAHSAASTAKSEAIATAAEDASRKDEAVLATVDSRGYLTSHQSLSAYSTTAQMNTAINNAVSGLAKASDVSAQIATATSSLASDGVVVKLSGNQSIAGNKTFTGTTTFSGNVALSKTPSSNNHAATKQYVDNAASTARSDAISSAVSSAVSSANAYSDSLVESMMRYKGTVANRNALDSLYTQSVGDVYNVTTYTDDSGNTFSGANFAWTGSAWDKLSETVDISSIRNATVALSNRVTSVETRIGTAEGQITGINNTTIPALSDRIEEVASMASSGTDLSAISNRLTTLENALNGSGSSTGLAQRMTDAEDLLYATKNWLGDAQEGRANITLRVTALEASGGGGGGGSSDIATILTQEIERAVGAETALGNRIDDLETAMSTSGSSTAETIGTVTNYFYSLVVTEQEAREASDTAEADARIAQDAAISNRFESAIGAEASLRESADTAISNLVVAVSERFDGIVDVIDENKNAITNIVQHWDEEVAKIDANTLLIETETNRASAVERLLDERISAIEGATGLNVLEDRVDTVETTIGASDDVAGTLRNRIKTLETKVAQLESLITNLVGSLYSPTTNLYLSTSNGIPCVISVVIDPAQGTANLNVEEVKPSPPEEEEP